MNSDFHNVVFAISSIVFSLTSCLKVKNYRPNTNNTEIQNVVVHPKGITIGDYTKIVLGSGTDLQDAIIHKTPTKAFDLSIDLTSNANAFVEIIKLRERGYEITLRVELNEKILRNPPTHFSVGIFEKNQIFDNFYNCSMPYLLFSSSYACLLFRKKHNYVSFEVHHDQLFTSMSDTLNTCNVWVLVPVQDASVESMVRWSEEINSKYDYEPSVFLNHESIGMSPQKVCSNYQVRR